MKLAAIAMPDTEPLRYAVDDLPGYGFEILADDVEVPIVGTLAKFERGELEGIGFIQTQTGNEVAAIAWPQGDPKRFLVIDLEGVGVKITDRMDPLVTEPEKTVEQLQAEGATIGHLPGLDANTTLSYATDPVVLTPASPAPVVESAATAAPAPAPASEVAASPVAPEAAADATSTPTTPAA